MNRKFARWSVASCLFLFALACNKHRDSVNGVVPDFTGFWKWHCSEDWGVQIKKQTGNLFSVSFCGPGGCFEPGTWMPNTPIIGDPLYHYINPTTLAIQHGDGWQTLTKCTSDPNPVLAHSTKPAGSPSTTQLETSPSTAKKPLRYVTQPAPTLPFFDWNACPFEGCRYGEWTASGAVEVFDSWRPNRKRIATLPTNAGVKGVSGVVITYRPGLIRLNTDLPEDNLHRGQTILTYTYRGEGFSAVWFNGRFYHDYDITFAKWPDGSGCLGSDCAGTYVDLGEKVWWAKVKMSSGNVGWVNMNDAKFDGVDQFAFVAPDSRFFRHKHSS
jgi:hypothetical protein